MINDQYKKFTETSSLGMPSQPPPPYIRSASNQKLSKHVRRSKILLAIIIVVSVLAFICGIITASIQSHCSDWIYYGATMFAVEFWAPIAAIITAGLGLASLRLGNFKKGCLLTSFFVMTIISAISCGILVIGASISAADAYHRQGYLSSPYYLQYTKITPEQQNGLVAALQALMGFHILSALIGLVDMVANIVASAFVCRYWCGKSGDATVLFVPIKMSDGTESMQAISLPPGAQVVLGPSGNRLDTPQAPHMKM